MKEKMPGQEIIKSEEVTIATLPIEELKSIYRQYQENPGKFFDENFNDLEKNNPLLSAMIWDLSKFGAEITKDPALASDFMQVANLFAKFLGLDKPSWMKISTQAYVKASHERGAETGSGGIDYVLKNIKQSDPFLSKTIAELSVRNSKGELRQETETVALAEILSMITRTVLKQLELDATKDKKLS